MSVSRSVSNSLSRSTSRSLGLARGSSGGSAFSPLSLSGLRQYALDGGEAYHDSTVGGYPVLRSLEPYGTHRQPRQGRAWLFDGVNDYGTTGTTLSNGSGEFSVSAWVKASALATGNASIGRGVLRSTVNTGAIGDFILGVSRTGQVSFHNWRNTGTDTDGRVATDADLVAEGVWCHIAVVWTGSVNKCYVNGSEVSFTSSGTTSTSWGTANEVGRSFGSSEYCWSGSLRDVRIFNVAKDSTAIANIKNGDDDATGLLAHYPCNEESGTTGYDISGNGNHLTLTNITQATFHATDTGVTSNRNNEDGYRLSGSVYIPKRLSDALAADGNALTVTGQSPYPINVEVPCVTGDGSTVYCDLGSPLIPATADFELSLWYYHVTNDTTAREVLSQREYPVPVGRMNITANSNAVGAGAGDLLLFVNASTSVVLPLSSTLQAARWHNIVLNRVGNSFTLACTPEGGTVSSATATQSGVSTYQGRNTWLLNRATSDSLHNNGRITDFRITTGGVTTYFPLQDGPGSSNTNRSLSYIKSDGTYGVVSGAIVNGTVSTIWGNRCPYAEDWSVNYGGDIAANGAFLPGQISGSLAADGTAKTLEAGKFGNPYSRANFNPFTAAELNGLGTETAYAKGTARQSVSPADTKFRRTAAAGDDRLITTSTSLTGTDKTNTEGYVA